MASINRNDSQVPEVGRVYGVITLANYVTYSNDRSKEGVEIHQSHVRSLSALTTIDHGFALRGIV